MLVHASLSASEEPEYALDDEVGYKPAHSALRYCAMDVCSLEEVGDKTIDG